MLPKNVNQVVETNLLEKKNIKSDIEKESVSVSVSDESEKEKRKVKKDVEN